MLSNNAARSSSFVNPSYSSSSFNNSSNINSTINNLTTGNNESSTNFKRATNENERAIRTEQLNSLNNSQKSSQIIRNHSSRSIGGRIAGRNPLYSQSSLPAKYEFETPGQAMKLNEFASSNQSLKNNQKINQQANQQTNEESNQQINQPTNNNLLSNNDPFNNNQSSNQLNNQIYSTNSYDKLDNSQSFRNSSYQSQRPKLVYQPRSHETDNSTSTYEFNERSDSIKEDNVSVAEKFKSNYEKFLEISRNIDFEEKLINLQLNKSKLKASARTSALLAGFAMVAYVELSFDDNDDEVNALNDANNLNQANGSVAVYNSVTIVPEFLIILFSLCTSLLVSVNILALMISTCLLPFVESISNSYNWLNDNDFQCLNDEFYELADNLKALSGKVSVLEAEDGKNAFPKICIIVDEYGKLGQEEDEMSSDKNDEEENNNLISVQDKHEIKHALTDQQINKMDEDLNYLNLKNYRPETNQMNSSYRSLMSKPKSLDLNRSTLSLNSNIRLNQPKSNYYSKLISESYKGVNKNKQIRYDLRPLIKSSRRRSLKEFTDKTVSSRDKYLEEHLNNLKKHERLNFFIECAWKFSNVYGVFLFLIEIIILGWVKFWEIGFPNGLPGKKAAFASTLVILPFLFIFIWFVVYFYKNFIMANFFSNFNLIRNINEFHNYKLVRTTSTGSLQSMV